MTEQARTCRVLKRNRLDLQNKMSYAADTESTQNMLFWDTCWKWSELGPAVDAPVLKLKSLYDFIGEIPPEQVHMLDSIPSVSVEPLVDCDFVHVTELQVESW